MLSAAVDAYLSIRRAVGYQLSDSESILRDFVRFASAKGETFVRTRTVVDWAQDKKVSPARKSSLLRTVARFARYAQAEDEHSGSGRPEGDPGAPAARARTRRRLQEPPWSDERWAGGDGSARTMVPAHGFRARDVDPPAHRRSQRSCTGAHRPSMARPPGDGAVRAQATR